MTMERRMYNTKDNLVVIIPAYEPPAEFIPYAERVAGIAKKLIVINDGSNERFNPVFERISELENVVYLTYGENHGKGYALKYAFKYCAENFPKDDVLVTADCDGQHRIEDVINVYKATVQHPEALILGSRDFNHPNVPPRSRFGNTNIRRIFRILYGVKVYDTQTGLRGMTVSLAERLIEVKGDRFEYEMGMLIYAQKNSIPISETPIATVYPEDPKEHVSHFKTFKDSMRMLSTVVKNLNWYLLSSTISAIVDVAVFSIFVYLVFGGVESAVNTLIATVTARVVSSAFNAVFNYKYVFGGKGKSAFVRYYILWFCQLGTSYGLVFLFGNVIGMPLGLTQALVNLLLAILSYQIQRVWVFRAGGVHRFYSAFIRICRFFARTFTKSYRCNVIPHDDATVYVCRHRDMRGPYTSLKWLDFHVHPMALHPFFKQKTCYEHFAGYTFTVREGKKRPKFHLKSWFLSHVIAHGAKGIQAIPVYRNSAESFITLRAAMKYLKKGESIIVYPDIDYRADRDTPSEIYKGFFALGEIYKRRVGKSLRFVPLYIDDELRTINEFDFVNVDNFKEDHEAAAEYIKAAINGAYYEKY